MRINSVSFNYGNFKINNNNRVQGSVVPLKNDVFTKSEEISFRGLSDAEKKKVSSFSKDLYRMIYIDGKFNLEGVQKIARKYDKDINVKSMDEAPETHGYRAMYTHKAQFDYDTFSVNLEDRTLYLEPSKPDDENKINELYVSAIHEFTHAIQANSKDMSCNGITKSYLARNKNNPDKERIFKNAVLDNQVARNIENIVAAPINNALSNPAIITKMITSPHTPKVGIEIVNTMSGVTDYNKFVTSSMNELFRRMDDASRVKSDKKHLLTYAAKHLECEAEAYNNEAFAYAKAMEKGVSSNMAYMVSVEAKVYQDAAKILNKMAREC